VPGCEHGLENRKKCGVNHAPISGAAPGVYSPSPGTTNHNENMLTLSLMHISRQKIKNTIKMPVSDQVTVSTNLISLPPIYNKRAIRRIAG